MGKSLTIQARPEDITIITKDDIIQVQIHSDFALSIELDNDVMLKSKGDFVISADGEIDLISNGNPICIDSINSKIFFNSREAKPIKNLPESLIYKQSLIEFKSIKPIKKIEDDGLEERVRLLENEVSILLDILKMRK